MGALGLDHVAKFLYSWFSLGKCYPQIMFGLQSISISCFDGSQSCKSRFTQIGCSERQQHFHSLASKDWFLFLHSSPEHTQCLSFEIKTKSFLYLYINGNIHKQKNKDPQLRLYIFLLLIFTKRSTKWLRFFCYNTLSGCSLQQLETSLIQHWQSGLLHLNNYIIHKQKFATIPQLICDCISQN